MPVQKLTQISAEALYQAIIDTKNQHYKHTTRLHVYVVRQNGRRKSNLDAFVSAQERSSGAHSSIGQSPVQGRAATSKNPTTCTLPSDLISHNLIHHRRDTMCTDCARRSSSILWRIYCQYTK